MRVESGNPRGRRQWGTIVGAGIKRRRRTRKKLIIAPRRQRRQRFNRRGRYSQRRQRGKGLFSSIGSGTVDRAFQNLEGIAPKLISHAIAELTTAGKDITDNAINQLIDIPKNRIKGSIKGITNNIQNKYTRVKNDAQKTFAKIKNIF